MESAPSSVQNPKLSALVLPVVSAVAFLASLDLFIVKIAFPDICAAFPGTGLATMSWVLNAYTVVFGAFLADRVRHSRRDRAAGQGSPLPWPVTPAMTIPG